MSAQATPQRRTLGSLRFSLLAVLIGVVAGFGAVAFRGLIAFFHNILFLGKLSFLYDANIHTAASPLGALVVLVPVVGAMGVVFLVKNFAPEAKGHGVPEVIDAIHYNRGRIRPVVAVIKSLASALSIGSGGAVGREGPIIQIGSSFASTVAQILRLPVWQCVTLIAGGAGAGIAATFNTPIGGILFAIEIMMLEVSVRTLVPVAIATATGTYISRLVFGPYPSFVVPGLDTHYFHVGEPIVLLFYVGLGVIMGMVSALFIRSLYAFEDFFNQRIKASYYVRHMGGMLLVGIMIYLLMIAFGHYYIEGVGYSTVQDILSGTLTLPYLLLLLFALKLLATSLTLGSGASGGIFSPSLFMGATLGGAYEIFVHQIFPGLSISPPAFAVAGMAGVVGGATGAAMTAIVMSFEMTRDYNVVIPMTITVALSYGVRKALCKESIYTMKLARRGHYIPEALEVNISHIRQARDVMDKNVASVPASLTLGEFGQIASAKKASWFLVEDSNKVIGVIARSGISEMSGRLERTATLAEIADKYFVVAAQETKLLDVFASMCASRVSLALIIRGGEEETVTPDNVMGVITGRKLRDVIRSEDELFSD